jgi:hypothetical protein
MISSPLTMDGGALYLQVNAPQHITFTWLYEGYSGGLIKVGDVRYEDLMRLFILSHFYEENIPSITVDEASMGLSWIFRGYTVRVSKTHDLDLKCDISNLREFFDKNMSFIEQGLKDYYYYQEKKEMIRTLARKELEEA